MHCADDPVEPPALEPPFSSVEVAVAPPEAPPIAEPVTPPTDEPVTPPTDEPVTPPELAAVFPPVDEPVVPPEVEPVLPPVDEPVAPPELAAVFPPVDEPVTPPEDELVLPPVVVAPVPPPEVLPDMFELPQPTTALKIAMPTGTPAIKLRFDMMTFLSLPTVKLRPALAEVKCGPAIVSETADLWRENVTTGWRLRGESGCGFESHLRVSLGRGQISSQFFGIAARSVPGGVALNAPAFFEGAGVDCVEAKLIEQASDGEFGLCIIARNHERAAIRRARG